MTFLSGAGRAPGGPWQRQRGTEGVTTIQTLVTTTVPGLW